MTPAGQFISSGQTGKTNECAPIVLTTILIQSQEDEEEEMSF